MLLDTLLGLRIFHEQFGAFLKSSESRASFAADTSGSPEPYDEFLNGVRVNKCTTDASLIITPDRWLELSAPPAELTTFSNKLLFDTDSEHTHWYSKPVSLIIEVDDERMESL